jgi:hypothetical protein
MKLELEKLFGQVEKPKKKIEPKIENISISSDIGVTSQSYPFTVNMTSCKVELNGSPVIINGWEFDDKTGTFVKKESAP